MSVRFPIVTRPAVSWSFVLVSLFLPLQGAAAQAAVGMISVRRLGQMPDSAAMAMWVRMRSAARFALAMQREIEPAGWRRWKDRDLDGAGGRGGHSRHAE